MKRIKWIVGSIVVVIVLVLVGVLLSINSIVRQQVEVQATSSLNLKTTLGSAHVSILGGSLGLNDLRIASPEGFAAERMLLLEDAKVGVTFGNLRSDPIRIDMVKIDKPKLVIEQANGKFNFQVLMDKPSAPTPAGSTPVKLIIGELAVNEAQVVLRPGIPGLAAELTIPIPSFVVKDIGTGEGNKNGAAIKDVVMLVVATMAKKSSDSDALPPGVKALLSLNADQVRAQVQGEINKQIQNISKDAGGAIEKGLGDLLKKVEPKPK